MADLEIGADFMDSRDIDYRIEELQDLEASEDADEFADSSDAAELVDLVDFKEKVSSDEWPHGITFIADDAFEDYAREFVEETLGLPNNTNWDRFPFNNMDWEGVASDLQQDYSSEDLDGTTYWYTA